LTEVERAQARPGVIRELATLEVGEDGGGGGVSADVRPAVVEPGDRLAAVRGTENAVMYRADPIGELTVCGPGAGMELAGQGVLSDLLAGARPG
jgi:homoserine dehydrogenase